MDIYSSSVYITGQKNYFISPRIDLSSSGATNLIFSVAYAQYNASTTDTLKVLISTDCGANWTLLYNKSGATLATAPLITSSFTPSASQWRSDTVSLAAYTGQSEVLFLFRTTADDGNNIYIDDIQIPSIFISVVQNIVSNEINVYPNPVSNSLIIEVPGSSETNYFSIYNTIGEEVLKRNFSSQKYSIDVSGLTQGIYIAEVKSGKDIMRKKLIKE